MKPTNDSDQARVTASPNAQAEDPQQKADSRINDDEVACPDDRGLNWDQYREFLIWERQLHQAERWSDWHEAALDETVDALLNALLSGQQLRSVRSWCSGVFRHAMGRARTLIPKFVPLEDHAIEIDTTERTEAKGNDSESRFWAVLEILYEGRSSLTRHQRMTVEMIWRHRNSGCSLNLTWKILRDLHAAWRKISKSRALHALEGVTAASNTSRPEMNRSVTDKGEEHE